MKGIGGTGAYFALRSFESSKGKGGTMKRIACMGMGLALLLGVSLAAQGQDQSGSLGDYARQVRKNGEPAKPKVYDNDNLPVNDKLSIVGTPSATDNSESDAAKTTDSTATSGGEAKAAGETKAAEAKPGETKTAETKAETKAPNSSAAGASPEEAQAQKQALWKQWSERLAQQKDQVDLLTRELNVLQREYQIRAAAMYGDVGNRLRNSGDWDKQDAQYKQQIADKQKAMDEAKQKLDDMQEEARKAGVPSSFLGE